MSKHQIQLTWESSAESERADAERVSRTCLARSNSSGANGEREKSCSPVQITTSRIGNDTWSIHAKLYAMTTHTYIHT